MAAGFAGLAFERYGWADEATKEAISPFPDIGASVANGREGG